jgi:hypothetical protein
MPRVHLIPESEFPAILAILRPKDGSPALIVVNASVPWRRILNLSRPLLPHHERRELARVLLTH